MTVQERTRVLDATDIRRAVTRIAHEILERNRGCADVVLVGVHTRGLPLAMRIAAEIGRVEGEKVPIGSVDIAFYRDDIGRSPRIPTGPTQIPADVDGATIIVVDDVLFTGRSVRAAIEAVLEFGRPRAIQLAVLIDRGHRELPIRPDYVGKNLPTGRDQQVKLNVDEIDGHDGVYVIGDDR